MDMPKMIAALEAVKSAVFIDSPRLEWQRMAKWPQGTNAILYAHPRRHHISLFIDTIERVRPDLHALPEMYDEMANALERALLTRNTTVLRKLMKIARDRIYGWRGTAAMARIAEIPQQTMSAWILHYKLPRLDNDASHRFHKGVDRLIHKFRKAAKDSRTALYELDLVMHEYRCTGLTHAPLKIVVDNNSD